VAAVDNLNPKMAWDFLIVYFFAIFSQFADFYGRSILLRLAR
jgi:hypothetical protein